MALAATMHQMELAKRTVNLSGGGGGSSSADQISYNNTTSGMIATNVQSAIDENATKIDDLSNKIGEDEIEVGDNVIDGLNTLNENLSQIESNLGYDTKSEITTLFSTNTRITSGNITLSNGVSNFEYLYITYNDKTETRTGMFIPVSVLKTLNSTTKMYSIVGYGQFYLNFYLSNETTITVNANSSYGIFDIYGVHKKITNS